MTWLKRPRQEEPAANSTLLIFGVDPTDPESLDYAGVRFARAGQREQAAQALLASARLGYPPGAHNYALVCEQAGRTREAEDWYTFAAEHGHPGCCQQSWRDLVARRRSCRRTALVSAGVRSR